MIQYKLNLLVFVLCVTTINMSILSADCGGVCDDNPTGIYTNTCDKMLGAVTSGGFGLTCYDSFAGNLVWESCHCSCNLCPSEFDGCALPDMTIKIVNNGEILFKSSSDIAGYEFKVDGITLNSDAAGSGGASFATAGYTVSTNPAIGKVLGYKGLTGPSIPAGCGILTRLDFSGSTPTNVHSMVWSDSYGNALAFTFGGVLTTSNPLSIVQMDSNIPTEFSVSQNYPNPFNPVTSIAFNVIEMNEISLVVYDLSGKEIITLVSGTYMPGSYSVNWGAVNNIGESIASGVYVYRYISGDKAISRKMLYLK